MLNLSNNEAEKNIEAKWNFPLCGFNFYVFHDVVTRLIFVLNEREKYIKNLKEEIPLSNFSENLWYLVIVVVSLKHFYYTAHWDQTRKLNKKSILNKVGKCFVFLIRFIIMLCVEMLEGVSINCVVFSNNFFTNKNYPRFRAHPASKKL
jgi:hypothetical protein